MSRKIYRHLPGFLFRDKMVPGKPGYSENRNLPNTFQEVARMLSHKERQLRVPAHREATIAIVTFPYILGANIIAQLLVFWLSAHRGIFPGTDAFMSIVATCSQIIAGLYGTTLAGYTFFLSRIDALMASDATIDYVVTSIKKRFKYLIWYMTFNVSVTLTFSVVLMYVPAPMDEQASFFYRLFCNEFLLFLAFSIVMILYYAVLVVNPNCVEKEAAKLKKKLCRRGPSGSATEFIALYAQIVSICDSLLPANVLDRIQANKGKRFEYTIELLGEQNIRILPLVAELTRVHRYYECTINCTPLCVEEEMCDLARRILNYLKSDEIKRF